MSLSIVAVTMTDTESPFLRSIRSFVRRQGRMSPALKQALIDLAPNYELPYNTQCLDLNTVFGRTAPRIMEIGFGNGMGFIELAQQNPQHDYLGVEVHRPGIANVFVQAYSLGLKNVRVIGHDVHEVLTHQIADSALDAVYIFFPDPWPKPKHFKRRLIQSNFVDLLVRKLKIGGIVHLATDWSDYARQMLKVLEAEPRLRNQAGVGNYSARPQWRPLTKYERRGQSKGHEVSDLLFERIKP